MMNDHMNVDDDIADIDPTPIHHPVDDEAIASAVNEAAVDVADDSMDQEHEPGNGHHDDDDVVDEVDVVPHNMKQEVEESQFDDDDHANNSQPSIGEEGNGKEETLTGSPSNSNPNVEESEGDDIRAMILREDEANAHKKDMKRRARRVGKVPVRKVPRLGEPSASESTTTTELAILPMPVQAVPEESTTPIETPTTTTTTTTTTTETIPRVLSKHDEKWNLMLKELENFKEKHGHTNVPQCYTQNSRLGRWVHYQRVEYWVFQEMGGGKITPDRIARLDAIGFEWDPQKAQWDKMFERLKEYYDEMGHCKVPKGYTHDPELANWVRNQRLEHANMNKGKKSRMTKERFKKLDDLGFKWSSITAKSKPLATLKDATTTTTGSTGSSEPPVKVVDETMDVQPKIAIPTNEKVAHQHPPLERKEDSTNGAVVPCTVKAMESMPEELPPVGAENHSDLASPKPLEGESDNPSSAIEI